MMMMVVHALLLSMVQSEGSKIDTEANIPNVVVGIHANVVQLEVEGPATIVRSPQLVLVEVWPSPDLGVDDMGKAFLSCYLNRKSFFNVNLIRKNDKTYLKPAVKSPRDGHTFGAVAPDSRDGRDQVVQLVPLLL